MTPNWGAVVLGGVAGLATGAILAIPLLAVGIAGTGTFGGQAALLLIGFIAQVVAGFVAGRFAGFDHGPGTHGGVAAIALYAVIASISIAGGGDPGVGTLTFGAVVALILGTAGGVLAAALGGRHDS